MSWSYDFLASASLNVPTEWVPRMLHYRHDAYSSPVNSVQPFQSYWVSTPKLSNFFFATSYCTELPDFILHCLILCLNILWVQTALLNHVALCIVKVMFSRVSSCFVCPFFFYRFLFTMDLCKTISHAKICTTLLNLNFILLLHSAAAARGCLTITMSRAILQKCFNFAPNFLRLSL